MDKVIAIHTLSDFERRFRVPKICQCKLCHARMPLTGEASYSRGIALDGSSSG